MLKVLLVALAGLAVLTAPSQPAAAQSSFRAVPTIDSANFIRPGDVIRLRIWREPDLSGDFPVDINGLVVFPKIGQVAAGSMTADSLKRRVVSAYEVYLRNPSIEMIFLRRINVLGAVKAPGLYPVDATMTLADVIAAAGGATP